MALTLNKKQRGVSAVPFAYRSGATALHRCPAGIKLLVLLALSLLAFSSIVGLTVSALIIVTGALFAKIRPWELLRGSKPLIVLALFIIVFKTMQMGDIHGPLSSFLTLPGFFDGLRQGLCIVVSFSAGSLLFSVTTMGELRESLGSFEGAVVSLFTGKKFKQGGTAYHGRISLGISLMLGFLPRFFELWETANLACRARAGKKGLARIILLVPLVTGRMMEMAAETAQALEARGFIV
ncbi:MAG: energy-coupling factor transporter transmembrane protein EcfT [Treponema sp.]|jgi:energy-coupling factor transporter transmembrane protein EcfT|nr:energy-coupling factor transporter transmembrane protein EcfT [Treponema sp.]